MPAFEAKLSKAEIAALVTYIRMLDWSKEGELVWATATIMDHL